MTYNTDHSEYAASMYQSIGPTHQKDGAMHVADVHVAGAAVAEPPEAGEAEVPAARRMEEGTARRRVLMPPDHME